MPTPAQLGGAKANTVWNGPDYLGAAGAHALAKRIEAYWRERGFEVLISIRMEGGVHVLRSNILGGKPQVWQAHHPAIRRTK